MKLTLKKAQEIMAKNSGNLNLRNNKQITELPEGLTVVGNLDIRNTDITELPEDITIGGWLLA
ncbi:MAG: hypothetical protein RSA79_00030 [Oscillospiraceae bacterium]